MFGLMTTFLATSSMRRLAGFADLRFATSSRWYE
jgi:hypothetical protein